MSGLYLDITRPLRVTDRASSPAHARRPTRQIHVGSVPVGGGAPITVQSMTITKTADVEGTLQQIYALAAAGCDIVRCTCNEAEAAEGLAQIVPRSPVPIIADIHHQYRMALAALEAGVHGLRLNPGNIRQPEHIKAVATEARDRSVPIRIGVNGGSLDPALYEKYGGVTPEAMVESAHAGAGLLRRGRLRPRQDLGEGVERAADGRGLPPARPRSPTTRCTSASPRPARRRPGWSRRPPASPRCCSRASATRSATRSPPIRSRRPAPGASCSRRSGLRERKNVDLIACPSCGRAEIDVIDVAKRAMEAFGERELPLQVAVMGCVVNGPGEAREADLGIAAGNKRGHLFVKGRNVAVVPEDEMVDALVEWAEFINEHGVEAAIARADTTHGRARGGPGPLGAARRPGRRRQPRRREDRRDPQDRPPPGSTHECRADAALGLDGSGVAT